MKAIMTLIVTRTSARYALMVTGREVTKDGVEHDPDANKNVLFGDRNAVVAVGYIGSTHIGTIPTDANPIPNLLLKGIAIVQTFFPLRTVANKIERLSRAQNNLLEASGVRVKGRQWREIEKSVKRRTMNSYFCRCATFCIAGALIVALAVIVPAG